jgi:chromate transporter
LVLNEDALDPGAQETRAAIFAKFLSFGVRAWGGPAAQLAMIREEAVAAGWITGERFNRLLAVYQVLPGPEATEMSVHLGLLRGGRVGAVLAGLGFMLPGLALMLLLSWAYVALGLSDPNALAYFVGFAPAVAALVVAACFRLGRHAVKDTFLGWVTAGVGGATAP